MAFPDDMDLDSNEANISLFPPSERPTANFRAQRTERVIRDSPDYVIGKMMQEIVRLRKETNRLNEGTNFGKGPFQALRTSIRPQVQNVTVSASISAAVLAIYSVLHQVGILK